MPASTTTLPRGTVTFLFTDIEGSTDLARTLGAAFGRVRREHRQALRAAFARHDGHEIDTAGDGFFVVFERAGDALAAAIDAQRSLHEVSGANAIPVRVRMGLHSAEPFLDDEGYVGVGVSRAARICAAGHGGQILVSNATAGIVEDLGLEGVELIDLGEHGLKDIPRPQRLFQVVVDGLPTEFPPLKSLDAARKHGSVVTLLVTDVVGWQGVLTTFGDQRAIEAARDYQSIVRALVTDDGGHPAELVADHSLSVFDRAEDALRCAVRLRERLRSERWYLTAEAPPVRMAIHSGQLADPTGRQLGSVALRSVLLCGSAAPGQVLVSHATQALLVGTLADASLRDLGERSLLEDDRPMRVFELPD